MKMVSMRLSGINASRCCARTHLRRVACGAPQILDVVRTHQFVLARRHGSWDVVETAALKRAKAEIKGLNQELEQRVVERTNQLMQALEALREAQTQLAHVNRVATMGELS